MEMEIEWNQEINDIKTQNYFLYIVRYFRSTLKMHNININKYINIDKYLKCIDSELEFNSFALILCKCPFKNMPSIEISKKDLIYVMKKLLITNEISFITKVLQNIY